MSTYSWYIITFLGFLSLPRKYFKELKKECYVVMRCTYLHDAMRLGWLFTQIIQTQFRKNRKCRKAKNKNHHKAHYIVLITSFHMISYGIHTCKKKLRLISPQCFLPSLHTKYIMNVYGQYSFVVIFSDCLTLLCVDKPWFREPILF